MNKSSKGQVLGIIDYRNIVSTIQEAYNMDFSNYAFTAFKRRIERVIQMNNMNSVNDLTARIRDDESFLETFLYDISIEETEMFRDPSLWRELRDDLFPKIITGNSEFRIWLPEVTSGEELYTLLIVLRESKLIDKVKVHASCASQRNIDKIHSGVYNQKKMETNNANYKRYKGTAQLSNYYSLKKNDAYMSPELFDNVKLTKHNFLEAPEPTKIKLVLYRNRLIYFNKKLEHDALRILHRSLLPGGYFIIGIKESLECCNADKKFVLVNKNESIYKKSYT